MLSWSATETDTPLDLRAITDPAVDPLVPGGGSLVRFVDAVLDRSGIAAAAGALRDELGLDGLIDAAGAIANFQMMNRIAEGTGMPVGRSRRRRHAGLIDRLGLARFDHQAGGGGA